MSDDDKTVDNKLLYCSFCGKSQQDVKKLIAGPSVFVCDECLDRNILCPNQDMGG